MKKVISLAFIFCFGLLFLPGCSSTIPGTSIPIGIFLAYTNATAPDDIFSTPGGIAYAANVHGVGVPDKWPPIQPKEVTLESLNISYRAVIETQAGTRRNNIINVRKSGGISMDHTLTLYSQDVPAGIALALGQGGGMPGNERVLLVIDVSPDITPGEYQFKIGIKFDGKYYGALPCTINVTP